MFPLLRHARPRNCDKHLACFMFGQENRTGEGGRAGRAGGVTCPTRFRRGKRMTKREQKFLLYSRLYFRRSLRSVRGGSAWAHFPEQRGW